MSIPIITLLTDFGICDEYVGVMKGVILSVNPLVRVVDITHNNDPQDLNQAAYLIKSFYRYFPENTIHVVVVDPGVGSGRSIIAADLRGHVFLAPDNGVLTLVMEEREIGAIVRVENPDYFLKSVSSTFHGRDIFAPVAAHISKGVQLKDIGGPVDKKELVSLHILKPFISEKGELIGSIVSIDRFGNLITSIDSRSLEKFCKTASVERLGIWIGKKRICGLVNTYESVNSQSPLAVIGSRGYLEIAVNCGNARRYFMAEKGDPVKLTKPSDLQTLPVF